LPTSMTLFTPAISKISLAKRFYAKLI